MPRWTTEHKTFCVIGYFETKSYLSVRDNFQAKFQIDPPAKSTIVKWVLKFKTKGTVWNVNSKTHFNQTHSGRLKTARIPDNIERVRDSVNQNPGTSIRRRSQELGLARESLRLILEDDLKLHPYRIQIKHSMTDSDKEKRVLMCEWFRDMLQEDPDFLNDFWFTDEAHILLSGHVNSKNCIFWGTQPPDEVLERPLHSVKCTVWVALSKHGIIGPYWFEDEEGQAATVNTERYLVVVRKFWARLGRERGLDRSLQWYQQDGAPPHTSNETLRYLRSKFQDRLISRRCVNEWAPHSPDLNPLDFFLWGYLKDNVFRGRPQTIPELKQAVAQKIREIELPTCTRVVDNFVRRIKLCIQRGGRHLEHVLKMNRAHHLDAEQ